MHLSYLDFLEKGLAGNLWVEVKSVTTKSVAETFITAVGTHSDMQTPAVTTVHHILQCLNIY